MLGRAAARAQAAAADHLFALLGYLPLAVSVALHLAHDCGWTLVQLNGQLEKAGAVKVLDSADNLQKSLQATFETSWERLPDDLRLAFRALALFNAGPSFSAAALADTLAVDEAEAGALLRRLAGRSLLNRVGEARWALHPLLREFAAGRQPADEATQARAAGHYVGVAREANRLFAQGHENVLRGLALFDLEWPHIRAGQAWAAARAGADEEAARLCSDYPDAAAHCLSLRLHPREQIAWLEAAAAAARRLGDKQAEGAHLGNLGNAYYSLGEVKRAIEFYEPALALAREIGDRRGEGNALGNLGIAYAALGEVKRAIEFYEPALAIARQIGNRRGEGQDLGSLGNAYAALGETRRAIEYYEQALAIHREIGDRRNEGAWLGSLGLAYAALGETQRAIEFYELALAISRQIGDQRGESNRLGNLGLAYATLGEARRALVFYEQALAISREIGDKRGEGHHLANMGRLYEDTDPAHAGALWAEALRIYEAIEDPHAAQVRAWLAAL